VLEEVREAGAPGLFVRRSDVVPQVHGDDRQATILSEDDLEAVREHVFLELDPGDVARTL
jgi:hypothetical protein